MVKQLALLAACVAAVSAKVFVFKANECNTNFNDPNNWENLDDDTVSNPMDEAPSEITFGDLEENFESVDVRVPAGEYNMGTLILQDNMVLSLDKDGVEMTISDKAQGPAARFVAGQSTEKGACSVGCHTNFYTFSGNKDDAAEVDLANAADNADLAEAEAAPCGSDTVVIPDGYNVNLLAMGFHAFRSIVYKSGEDVVEAKAMSQAPQFSFFPVDNMRVFIGDNVEDQCKADGMLNDDDQCICASECPASDIVALSEANTIRAEAKKHATRKLAKLEDGEEMEFKYSYFGAFGEDDVAGECEVKSATLRKELKSFYNSQVSISDTDVTVDTAKLLITVTGTANSRGDVLTGQDNAFDGPIKIGAGPSNATIAASIDAPVDLNGNDDASFAMGVYAALIGAIGSDCTLSKVSKAALLKAAGIYEAEEEQTTVFGGHNLPQIDVNRLVDDNNKEGVITAVYDALETAQAWTDLNKDVMLENWGLADPEEIHKERREAPARLGLATSLVRVKLEYNRMSTAAGINKQAVQDIINWVFATYDTQTHHKCFTFQAGFDDACITEIVAGIIAQQLQVCAKKDKASVEKCEKAAFDLSLQQIISIKGCGLLGSKGSGDKKQCIDAAAEARIRKEAETTASAAVDAAIQVILKEHADDLAAAYAAEVLFNKTRDEKLATLKEKTDLAVKTAILDAGIAANGAGNDKAKVQVLLGEAKKSQLAAQQAAAAARKVYNDCLQQADATESGEADAVSCDAEEKAYFAAVTAADVADAVTKTYQAALDTVGMSDADKQKAAEEAANAAANLEKQVATAEGEVAAKKKAFDANGCEEGSLEGATCKALFTELEAARNQRDKLQRQLDAAKLSRDALNSAAGAPSGDDEEEDGLPIIPIAAGIGGCVVIGIIFAVLVVLKGGDNGKKGAGDARNVVAFANPMYDDPAAGAGMGPAASYEEGKDDQGLYDEPAFHTGAATDKSNPMYASNEDLSAGGNGYLDVQPDDDDDDDSDDDSEDDE